MFDVQVAGKRVRMDRSIRCFPIDGLNPCAVVPDEHILFPSVIRGNQCCDSAIGGDAVNAVKGVAVAAAVLCIQNPVMHTDHRGIAFAVDGIFVRCEIVNAPALCPLIGDHVVDQMRTVKESDRTVADHGGQSGVACQPGGVCFFQLIIVKNPAGGTVGIDRDAAVAGQRMFLLYNGITAIRGDKIRAVSDKGVGGLIGIGCDNDLVLHDRDKKCIGNCAVLVQAVEDAAVLRQVGNITWRIRGIQRLAVQRRAGLRVDDQQSDIPVEIGVGAVRAVRIVEDIKAVLCAKRERAAAGVFLPRGQNLTAEGIAGIPDGVSIDPCLGRCAGTDDRFSRGIGGISVILCLFGIDGNGAVRRCLCQRSKRASEQYKHGQDGQQHWQYAVLHGFGQPQNPFPDRM